MATPESFLRPDVIRQVARLDLRARFIVEGFLSGLHASPFQGFSVEFSEHRKYVPGDDLKDLDWNVFAKTDKYYLKKYRAETNVTGYLAMDLSASMGYTYRQELTKFEYSISLAAALGYLMIHQQDPVGLVTFDTHLHACLPPRSRRTHLAAMLSVLANLRPTGNTDLAGSLNQLAIMVKTKSLIMIFSDLLVDDPAPVLQSLHHLRHRGHEVILFHILDEAEVNFSFREPLVEFHDVESSQRLTIDTAWERKSYLERIARFRARYQDECAKVRIDYVPIDTSVSFDKALIEYLTQRQRRF